MTVPPEPERRRGSGRRSARGTQRKRGPVEATIGVIGELLITAGILVGLFLGWQVWWNNLVLSGQQTSAAQEQSKKWIDEATTTPRPTPTDSTKPVAVDPPVMAQPASYEPFAVIYIPRLGPDWKRTIRQTVDVEKVLNSYTAGVGHYPDTQMPGEVGNFAVAGHDSGWGNTFIDLSKLRVGDHIYVQTKDGWYTYVFRNFEYVQPTQVQVIAAVPRHPDVQPIDRLMTITTCNPPFHAGERLIAYNVFQGFAPTQDVPAEIRGAVTGG
ncbi:class E sortase [Leifsonia shinshuensis]|uniref:class E sortase n=1 Tax=Leifsonia shinshuensis TaxID=150026 RepID=UPI001F508C63|nr:class E sortase [Leifsonia shinshuensis]MCI0156832.1 class E sortase [Leifsonia shinshuensis]